MKADDKFIKVEMTAYFAVNGRNIEEKKDSEIASIYMDGKPITPEMDYCLIVGDEDFCEIKKMPKKMQLEFDEASWTETIITRAQRWAEDPSSKHMDEIIEKTEKGSKKKKTSAKKSSGKKK